MTASAIEAALSIPQPSALVLARELLELGHFAMDRVTREYSPTARVAELGAWLTPSGLPRQRQCRTTWSPIETEFPGTLVAGLGKT